MKIMQPAKLISTLLLTMLAGYGPIALAEYSRSYMDSQPMSHINTNGVEIAYQVLGPENAETAVLVMGLGASHTVWGDDFVRGIIAAGYRVVLIDNRDTGESIRYAEEDNPVLWWQLLKYRLGLNVSTTYQLSDMAEDIINVMDTLEIDKAHLVGASMGGMIAQVIAAEHPERSQTLVSIMSTTWAKHLPQPDKQSTDAIRNMADNEDEEGKRAEFMKKMGFHAEAIPRQVMAILHAGDRSDAVKTITTPTLVIHGREDPLLTVEHGEHTAELINESRLVIFEGMGHNIPDAVRPNILREIGEHLSSHPVAGL
ncbi:MAG: alpha/beta hydrolase [Gammaproteobacteria bacterium]|nr:alpha/beta hydrolase [Gammaproteobacteria bacterium]MBT6244524.1 alpha/beta hydrolase [Gammaproteobacteria bacterium]